MNAKELIDRAVAEVNEETTNAYAAKIKEKIRHLNQAKRLVKNLELELEDIKAELEEALS